MVLTGKLHIVHVDGWAGAAATFLSSSSSVVLTRLSAPRSRPTTFFLVVQGIEPLL
jgi:hypothetical protein